MKITSKGQVTIPVELREKLGLLPHTEVTFTLVGGAVRLSRAGQSRRRGRGLVAALRGRGDVKLSTDAIMALTRR